MCVYVCIVYTHILTHRHNACIHIHNLLCTSALNIQYQHFCTKTAVTAAIAPQLLSLTRRPLSCSALAAKKPMLACLPRILDAAEIPYKFSHSKTGKTTKARVSLCCASTYQAKKEGENEEKTRSEEIVTPGEAKTDCSILLRSTRNPRMLQQPVTDNSSPAQSLSPSAAAPDGCSRLHNSANDAEPRPPAAMLIQASVFPEQGCRHTLTRGEGVAIT